MERQDEAFKTPFKKTFTVNGETEEKLVTLYEFVEFDERGKEICHRYYRNRKLPNIRHRGLHVDAEGKSIWHNYPMDCFEIRREYDANGNEIYCKNSYGHEHWHEYDERGKLVRGKIAINGVLQENEWYDCDERGNIVHWKQIDPLSNVYEEWRDYDKNGNCISVRESCVMKEWPENDKNLDDSCQNNRLSWLDNYFDEHRRRYEYDEHGRLVFEGREKLRAGWRHEYDEKGNRVRSRNGDSERRFKYDERGRLAYHIEDRRGLKHFYLEEWRDYDEAGREVRRKYRTKSYEETRWYEYELHENGEPKTLAIYRHHENLENDEVNGRQSDASLEGDFDGLE